MQWFSVRAIFSHGLTSEGDAAFEEKITVYRAADAEAAVARAEGDVREYLQLNPSFSLVSSYSIFALGADTDLDGAEVWSVICLASPDPGAFVHQRYEVFEPKLDRP